MYPMEYNRTHSATLYNLVDGLIVLYRQTGEYEKMTKMLTDIARKKIYDEEVNYEKPKGRVLQRRIEQVEKKLDETPEEERERKFKGIITSGLRAFNTTEETKEALTKALEEMEKLLLKVKLL